MKRSWVMSLGKQKRVVIVGGGFGGVACALRLAELGGSSWHQMKVTLVSDRPHFEYHGALYRLVTGRSPLEICIPLREIFEDKGVEVNVEKVERIQLENSEVIGVNGSRFRYDYLVLGLGSETSYYNTPGLEKLAFGFKSITEALRLKTHLHKLMEECFECDDLVEQAKKAHVVVVGGGASGTELAADLAVYMRGVARKHGVDPAMVAVDLIQSPNRLLPDLPEKMSRRIEERVRSLGVNVYLNRRVVREQVERVYLKDMEIGAKTLVWTAGVRGNSLYEKTGLPVDERGRVRVNGVLQAKGFSRVFVVGDGAMAEWGGMAQTALAHGRGVADNLVRKMGGGRMKKIRVEKPIYAIPCGPSWAAVLVGERQYYGWWGWGWRRYLDWVVFRSLLPLGKAWTAWRSGGKLCEICEVCGDDQRN